MPEKYENATITGHFGFVLEKNSRREIITMIVIDENLKFYYAKPTFFKLA